MTNRDSSTLTRIVYRVRPSGSITVGIAFALPLLLFCVATNASADAGKGQSTARACTFSDAEFDPATDTRALEKYQNAVAELLKDEQFTEIDCIAKAAQEGKTRFSGGEWKLHSIYLGLSEPRPGRPTQEDWQKHFRLMENWRDQSPHSITAQIALARSYGRYAWDARGRGYSDSVSESGWKLFGQRMEEARKILEEISATPITCPEWYFVMQQVALGQSWDMPEAKALFEKAIAFEPKYYYYDQIMALYLQPKWHGETGDPERFAQAAADRVGGVDGDIVYFQIGAAISCGCDDPEAKYFSWSRLEKGFESVEKQYGPSLLNANYAALMASKANDWIEADPLFQRIGDNWDKGVWITEQYFKQNQQAASQMAPLQAKGRQFKKDAEANMSSAAGQEYRAKADPKLKPFEEPCLEKAEGNLAKFQFFIEVGKDGMIQNGFADGQTSPLAMCMMRAMYDSFVRKETVFPPPPSVPYRMVVEVDPTTLKGATK